MFKENNEYYLIYGPPGVGKTTLARYFCKKEGLSYLSVGEVTRKEIKDQTDLGKKLKKCLDKVVEYPPDLISHAVEPQIVANVDTGFMLDGFPKYSREIDPFLKIMASNDIKIDAVINLQLPIQKAIERVQLRRICNNCGVQHNLNELNGIGLCPSCNKGELVIRNDDKTKIFKRRFQDYLLTITDTLESLRGSVKSIVNVDASGSTKLIFSDILSKLGKSPGSSAERADT